MSSEALGTAAMNQNEETRYAFGKNWSRFIDSCLSSERIDIAQNDLLAFLKMESFEGLRFVDIGCGSGLHSLAAYRAGAKEVVSFDFDADSIAATQQLHQMAGCPKNWTIQQGSVLDVPFLQSLGTFDIVYSWGVLHHTGALWRALGNALSLMEKNARLYIALYDSGVYKKGMPEYWLGVKQRYNQASSFLKLLMECRYFWTDVAHKRLGNVIMYPKLAHEYQKSRGMDLWTDIRDWLGGWPMEFSSVQQVCDFAAPRGLALVNLQTGEANASYLFVPHDKIEALGYTEMYPPVSIEVVEAVAELPRNRTCCIFGTGRGSRILLQAMRDAGISVGCLIDLDKTSEMDGVAVENFNDFARRYPPDTGVFIPNKYVVQNAELLLKHGFSNIFNALPLIRDLAQKKAYRRFL